MWVSAALAVRAILILRNYSGWKTYYSEQYYTLSVYQFLMFTVVFINTVYVFSKIYCKLNSSIVTVQIKKQWKLLACLISLALQRRLFSVLGNDLPRGGSHHVCTVLYYATAEDHSTLYRSHCTTAITGSSWLTSRVMWASGQAFLRGRDKGILGYREENKIPALEK